jgi:tetratricopeptide (TPR) repeat protein
MALARLSVFAGGFDLSAAEAVAGADEADAFGTVDLVSSLVDKSLVQSEVLPSGRTRYRLLESVREYASARLAALGPRDKPIPEDVQPEPGEKDDGRSAPGAMRREPLATRWRHATYFLSVAEGLAPKLRKAAQLEAIEGLNLEMDNLRTALGMFQEHGPAEMLRMLVALSYYWVLRGQLSETLGWYDVSPVGDESQDPDARAELVTMSTLVQLFGGDLEGGARKLSELEKVTHRCRDRCRWEAWGSILAAFTKIFQPDLARALARDAVEKVLLCGGPWDFGAALTLQGEIERVAGNIRAAEPLYRRALELFEQEGDRFWLCVNILNVGECAVQSDEYEAAVPLLASMLPLLREMGNEFLMAYCCIAMGCAAAGLRQWQEACLVLGAGLWWVERRGMSIEPVEQMMVTKARATLTIAIGENALEELLSAGRHARPEPAIEQCLRGLGVGREEGVGGGSLQATTGREPHPGN